MHLAGVHKQICEQEKKKEDLGYAHYLSMKYVLDILGGVNQHYQFFNCSFKLCQFHSNLC